MKFLPTLCLICFVGLSMVVGPRCAAANSGGSKTPQQAEDDKICHAFIEYPHQFVRINDKARFEEFGYGGTCSSGGIKMAMPDGHWEELSPLNGSNGFGTPGYVIPMSYKGKIYFGETGRSDEIEFLLRLDGDNMIVMCGFLYHPKGWKISKGLNPQLCQKFHNEQFTIVGESPPDYQSGKLAYGAKLPPDTIVDKFGDVSFAGDAQRVKVFYLEYLETRGCGCGAEYLSIAGSQPEGFAPAQEQEKLSKALSNFTEVEGCSDGDSWSVVSIGGKGYVATNLPLIASDASKLNLDRGHFRDRSLYQYENGSFKEICRMHPLEEKVIDREYIEPYALDYKPE